jgi:hypothetical protein
VGVAATQPIEAVPDRGEGGRSDVAGLGPAQEFDRLDTAQVGARGGPGLPGAAWVGPRGPAGDGAEVDRGAEAVEEPDDLVDVDEPAAAGFELGQEPLAEPGQLGDRLLAERGASTHEPGDGAEVPRREGIADLAVRPHLLRDRGQGPATVEERSLARRAAVVVAVDAQLGVAVHAPRLRCGPLSHGARRCAWPPAL